MTTIESDSILFTIVHMIHTGIYLGRTFEICSVCINYTVTINMIIYHIQYIRFTIFHPLFKINLLLFSHTIGLNHNVFILDIALISSFVGCIPLKKLKHVKVRSIDLKVSFPLLPSFF